MKKIAVNWNTAYDTILLSNNNLNEVLDSREDSWLELSYIVSDIKEQLWGSALNISYNMALLWLKPKLFTAVWNDFIFPKFFEEYVDLSNVYFSKNNKTAKSFITTDSKNSHINAFYLWAIQDSDKVSCNVDEKFDYAIVSSNSVDSMLMKLKDFKRSWSKVLFDPGSQIIQMKKEEIIESFKYADYLIVNKYEFELIKKISELTDSEIIESFDKIIITYWLKWSKIFDNNYFLDEIEWVENQNEIDSTWCWDAYRAGLLYGLSEGYTWKSSARLWSVLASVTAWFVWSQNHTIDSELLEKLYVDTFWENLEK